MEENEKTSAAEYANNNSKIASITNWGQGLRIKVLPNGKGLELPAYKTKGAAGFDLAAATTATLFPGQVFKMPTGLAFAIQQGFWGLVKSRGSSNAKGLRIDGVVDSDYRGEVFLVCANISSQPIRINRGDRIGQMVLMPVVLPVNGIEFVDELEETERGAGAFGSTGGSL
jgi:dUTP pyrophosphatase